MVRIDHLSPEQYRDLPARERDLLLEQPETPCPLGISSADEEAEEEEKGDNDSSTKDEFREEKIKSGERTHDGDDGSTLHRVELGPCTHLF